MEWLFVEKDFNIYPTINGIYCSLRAGQKVHSDLAVQKIQIPS